MRILAIETSCDETAISVLEIKSVRYRKSNIRILSNVVASQVKIHAKWGGVVPNLAKREHQRNLVPILKQALKEAKLLKKIIRSSDRISDKMLRQILEREPELFKNLIPFLKKYRAPKMNLIAVTQGPGLEPCLWQGINFTRALAKFWEKPILPINHMEGHIFSVFLEKNRSFQIPKTNFPAIALLVSGGHTELVLIKKWLKYKVIGQTLDDAAGEAFDKVARLLNLGYPGGPAIANCAAHARTVLDIKLPRPMINAKDYNFSFSGLKTAVLYKIKEFDALTSEIKTWIAREFQQATIDVLVKKTIRAAKEYKAKTIILGGGVAANKELRHQMEIAIEETNFENRRRGRAPERSEGGDKRFSKFSFRNKLVFLKPEMEFTGDNAAMIASAAYFRWQKTPQKKAGQVKRPVFSRAIKADGNLKLK